MLRPDTTRLDAGLRAEALHRESLVFDTLFTNGLHSLPGESEDIGDRVGSEIPGCADRKSTFKDAIDGRWLHTDMQPWSWWVESGVSVIHTTMGVPEGLGEDEAFRSVIQDIGRWSLRFDRSDQLIKVTRAQQALDAKLTGRYGVILGVQNMNWLDVDLERILQLYGLGIRIMQLTYNLRNRLGDGCTERRDGGLSELGLRAVARLNEIGVLVDVSHCGPITTLEVIEASRSPVVITHSSCRSVYEHDRGKTDDVLRALRDNGGYFGVLLEPSFIAEHAAPSLDDVLNHIEHAVEIVGASRVGIGTDYGHDNPKEISEIGRATREQEIRVRGLTRMGWRDQHFRRGQEGLRGFRDWRDFPNLTSAMVKRGYSDEDIRGFLGQNALAVFQQVAG